jgi:hypothetical protein
VRQLRELVRFRAKLVALRSGLNAQVHAVLAKQGVLPRLDDIFGPEGQRFLDETPLDEGYTIRVESLRDLIELYDREIATLESEIYRWLRDDAGHRAIQSIHGGRTMAAVLVAEIDDVRRFRCAEALCSWAGLTPRTSSRTPRSSAGDHPHGLSAGALGRHRSRRPLTTAGPPSVPPTGASRSGAAPRSPASPRHARFPPSSSTATTAP